MATEVVVVVVVAVVVVVLTQPERRRVRPGRQTHAPNYGDHPVDMILGPCTCAQGPTKLNQNLAKDENRPQESSAPARELGRETPWAT